MLLEYVKAIDLLTISEEKQLKREVEKLKTQSADMDMMKKMHLDMKLQLEQERERSARLQEQSALTIQYVIETDPGKKVEISRKLIELGYLPK